MNLELDHFFILVEPGAKVADLVVCLGMEESFSRDHEGQGTSNRRFELSNSMLEFLWVRDAEEANSGPGRDLLFPARAENPAASPFGVILCRTDSTDLTVPFNGWSYQPEYFPPPTAFHIGINSSNVIEPLCIYTPFLEPLARKKEEGTFKSLSHVHIYVPVESLSEELKIAGTADRLSIEAGHQHLMEITFDDQRSGNSKDLRPALPVILKW